MLKLKERTVKIPQINFRHGNHSNKIHAFIHEVSAMTLRNTTEEVVNWYVHPNRNIYFYILNRMANLSIRGVITQRNMLLQ